MRMREAALGDEVDAVRGRGLLDRAHEVVEPHAEVRVVPADERPLDLLQEEPQVVLQDAEVERLVRHDGVDAEAARVRAAEAAEHRHHLDERRLRERRLDELPALPHSGERERLARRREVQAVRAMRRAVLENVPDHVPVGEAEHVVEIGPRVLGIAARVRAAEDGDGAAGAEEIAEGVGRQRRLGERADEDEVEIARKLVLEVLESGVGDVRDLVALRLAPHGDDLRHDAREIRVHHPGVESPRGSLGYEVDDSDPVFTQERPNASGTISPLRPHLRRDGGPRQTPQDEKPPFLVAFFLAVSAASGASLAAQPLDPSLFSGLSWRLVGPFRGGRALTATGVPGEPNRFYFGAVGGGVWKTDNAGRTWEPIFDTQPVASIGAIAVAPSDPNVLYVGRARRTCGRTSRTETASTGRRTAGRRGRASAFRTRGRSAGFSSTRRTRTSSSSPRSGTATARTPSAASSARRTAGRAGRRSSSRTRTRARSTSTSSRATASTILAALWQTRRPPWNVYPPSNGPGSGLYRSEDGGDTWKPVTDGLPTEKLGRIRVAFAPSAPKRVYAIVDAKEGGLYVSDDARRHAPEGERRPAHLGARLVLRRRDGRPEGRRRRLRVQHRALSARRTAARRSCR